MRKGHKVNLDFAFEMDISRWAIWHEWGVIEMISSHELSAYNSHDNDQVETQVPTTTDPLSKHLPLLNKHDDLTLWRHNRISDSAKQTWQLKDAAANIYKH